MQLVILESWPMLDPRDRLTDHHSQGLRHMESNVNALPSFVHDQIDAHARLHHETNEVATWRAKTGNERLSHSPQEWDAIRPIVQKLYLTNKLPLREVMQKMKQDHDFEAA